MTLRNALPGLLALGLTTVGLAQQPEKAGADSTTEVARFRALLKELRELQTAAAREEAVWRVEKQNLARLTEVTRLQVSETQDELGKLCAEAESLDKELAEQVVAFKEWAQLYDGEPNSPLVRRDLQVNHAKAELKAAEARLETSKLNLERTEIRVPFDGRISEEAVDIGQFVTVGQSLATVYSTEAMEIIIPLRDRELAWFDVPLGYQNGEEKANGKGSEVEVKADFAGGLYTWQGRVLRTEGRIDPMSRMVNVVVEVIDPFKLTDGRPPLVPGMFVEVNIKGREMTDVISVPRYAVHNRDEVWIEDDGVLRVVKAEIIRQDKGYAYVSSGVSDGAVVVTSPLDAVTDGMEIRVAFSDGQMIND